METATKKFLGVCLWLAKKLNIDVSMVRIGFVVLTILGVGAPILAYFVIFILLEMKIID